MLGILGGMGPLATADLMQKIIARTPAEKDQEHLPMLVYSIPQVPDRTDAILNGGVDPLPEMVRGIEFLNQNGASLIAIACNTAHHWYSQLSRASQCPILHIADATVGWMSRYSIKSGVVGLLATTGTIASGFYQNRLSEHGYTCRIPSDQDDVMEQIRLIKGSQIGVAASSLGVIADGLIRDGCQCIILGCTEIPIALRSYASRESLIDATEALAQGCVDALKYCPRRLTQTQPANAPKAFLPAPESSAREPN